MPILKDYLEGLIGLIYPRLCIACTQQTPIKGDHFCINCMLDLPTTLHFTQKENDFTYHFLGRIPLLHGAALLNFYKENQVKSILYRLKYEGKQNIGTIFGKRIGDEISSSVLFNKVDVILPVPLHKKRLFKRGYNQSALLAEGIGKTIKADVNEDILIKTKHTESLTKQTRSDRTTALLDSLHLQNTDLLEGKHILLVDDVLTTGATLEACALKLLDVPDVKISMVTLAITKS